MRAGIFQVCIRPKIPLLYPGLMKWVERFIHNDISPFLFVIPGLTRNPVPSWIPAFAGMTECAVKNAAVYSLSTNSKQHQSFKNPTG